MSKKSGFGLRATLGALVACACVTMGGAGVTACAGAGIAPNVPAAIALTAEETVCVVENADEGFSAVMSDCNIAANAGQLVQDLIGAAAKRKAALRARGAIR